MPIIYDIQQAASIQPINIDNYAIREKIKNKQLFQTVPAVLLNYPDENRVEVYEGQDVLSLLNNVCQLLGKPSIHEALNQYTSSGVVPMRSSSPSRADRGKTSLSFGDEQSVPSGKKQSLNPNDMAVKIEDPFREQKQLQELVDTEPSENFRTMYTERMSTPLDIKKGEGHESLQNSSLKEPSLSEGKGFTPLSFDSSDEDSGESSLLMRPSDVSKADMSGSAAGSSSRELEAKQKRINTAAQDMMRERDELDQTYNKKR